MLNEDTFHFAAENTQVILAPQRRIETFGSTVFRFYLVSELMDSVDEVRVRDGRLHAERPQIITPGFYHQAMLEGFGEKAGAFLDWLRDHERDLAILKYGFQFRKTDVSENIVRLPLEEVIAKLKQRVDQAEDPLSAIIQGVDEGWEVCLLKFASDMIQDSAGGNLGDFRRRGLL